MRFIRIPYQFFQFLTLIINNLKNSHNLNFLEIKIKLKLPKISLLYTNQLIIIVKIRQEEVRVQQKDFFHFIKKINQMGVWLKVKVI